MSTTVDRSVVTLAALILFLADGDERCISTAEVLVRFMPNACPSLLYRWRTDPRLPASDGNRRVGARPVEYN